jgi:hypothetical protein
LEEILPILAKLSKIFQAGTINFSCIEPSIQEAKDALWTMAILDFLGNCSVHFAISIWTLTSVAVLFGESSKNFQRYRNMSDVSATNSDSETLLRVLKECTKELDGNKLCGLVTDGASTMTGKINGLAARIKREHPTVLSVHCICQT